MYWQKDVQHIDATFDAILLKPKEVKEAGCEGDRSGRYSYHLSEMINGMAD